MKFRRLLYFNKGTIGACLELLISADVFFLHDKCEAETNENKVPRMWLLQVMAKIYAMLNSQFTYVLG